MKFTPSTSPAHVVRARQPLAQSEKLPPHLLSEEWPTPSPSNENRERRPTPRRASRTFARSSVVFLIGIIATLAFQQMTRTIETLQAIEQEISHPGRSHGNALGGFLGTFRSSAQG
jgi:hypothetical protein